jgi:hypothetical protein
MTETTQPAGLPATGSRGRPLKMTEYLTAGNTLAAAVNRYRQPEEARLEPTSEDGTAVTPTPTPTKPKAQRLPPLETPTPIPGFPLAASRPGEDVPDYVTIGRAKRLRNGRVLLDPSGPPSLLKRHEVRTWKVAE